MTAAVVVRDQAGFDAAVQAGAERIRIDSPRAVWVEVFTPREIDVEAFDSASVTASGTASVTAYDSATVRAYDSASVTAYDSASVRAFDSASVTAFDSASVRASNKVAVHLHSGQARIDGGVLIDHTDVDLTDAATWLDYKGVAVADGIATFYKAVDADLYAGHGYTPTRYPIGETVTAPDWDPQPVCGGGLHATGDPLLSETYYSGAGRCRYLELAVPVDGLVLLDDKVKFQTCTVVREVTITGAPIDTTAVTP